MKHLQEFKKHLIYFSEQNLQFIEKQYEELNIDKHTVLRGFCLIDNKAYLYIIDFELFGFGIKIYNSSFISMNLFKMLLLKKYDMNLEKIANYRFFIYYIGYMVKSIGKWYRLFVYDKVK